MTKGIGITATILLQEGRLRVGDYFYAEGCWGKVNNITSTTGKSEISCIPGHPYTISGFSEFPPVGSSLMQVDLKTAKKKADQFLLEKQTKKQQVHSHKKDKPVYNVIIKADVFSSLQAIEKSIDTFASTNTFSHPMILSATLGELTENDINFAILSKSVIYLFNTKYPTKKELIDLIEKNALAVKQFDVIYHLLEDIKKQIDEEKDKKPVLKKIGDLLIIKLFHIKGIGTIVGFRVKEGVAKIGAHARLLRQKILIGEGTIKSLQKEKISVKELSKGNEGAIFINGITDFKEGDTVEVSE
jgi:translation initiation factor IF-2